MNMQLLFLMLFVYAELSQKMFWNMSYIQIFTWQNCFEISYLVTLQNK